MWLCEAPPGTGPAVSLRLCLCWNPKAVGQHRTSPAAAEWCLGLQMALLRVTVPVTNHCPAWGGGLSLASGQQGVALMGDFL